MPEQFVFRDLRDLLAKANEEKSGDQLAGSASLRTSRWVRSCASR
jgi:ethanolamine ammonia-lyase large subunit